MTREAVVAGGGIGGLAAALAVSRSGWDVRLLERSAAFSDIGAGIQLGPNVVKVLRGWGLGTALDAVAAVPEALQVRCALSSRLLGALPLGATIAGRYGAPYLTLHRADLHALLLAAVARTGTRLNLNQPLQTFSESAQAVMVQTQAVPAIGCDVLIGADGLWSTVRQHLLGDGAPRLTGHLAYRALVPQAALPQRFKSCDVTVWLGPRLHLVHYPVRGGEALNVVAFVHGQVADDTAAVRAWDHSANARDLQSGLQGCCAALRDFALAVGAWRMWVMYDRPPMQGAHQHALGRVALLGDAAHPMRPYLAQGAGMAIEDAAALGEVLSHARAPGFDAAMLLQRYALVRWQRNARVQARALRNGQIFHADGLLRWGRNASMKLLGDKLLDMPWLYGHDMS